MRIVSKFHDYYDSVMAHGQDLGVVYIRKKEEITDLELLDSLETAEESVIYPGWSYKKKRHGKPPIKLMHPYLPSDRVGVDHSEVSCLAFDSGFVLFCGKVYRYLHVKTEYKPTKDHFAKESTVDFFYSFEEFEQVLQTYRILVKDIYGRHYRFFDADGQVLRIREFLNNQGSTEFEQLLVEKEIVIAGIQYDDKKNKWLWHKDCPLADVKFYKLKDPFTTFQELDMYISGVLGQQGKEVDNISDKDRIHQRGFDEYSFRKLPQEKKRNR